jgi:hypothetical protein
MIRNANEPMPSTGKTRNVSSASCHEQDRGRADERQRGAEQRHDPVRDELVERLDVVGQARDEHAGLAAREEGDRQRLQVREQLDAQVLQHALADPPDQVRLRVGRAPVEQRGEDERDDDEVQRAGVARHDPVVDRQLRQRRRRERCGSAGHERDEHEDRPAAVRAQQLQQPAQLAPAPARRAPAPDEVVAPAEFLRAHRPAVLLRGVVRASMLLSSRSVTATPRVRPACG